MIEIAKLSPDRWELYRDLRLEALACDPVAFASSFEEEVGLPKETWLNRIPNAIFAFEQENPVGLIVWKREDRIKTRHTAYINSMYVTGKFRGQGIGGKLMTAAIDSIQTSQSILKIRLSVITPQVQAFKLYSHFGFKTIGTAKNELYVNGLYYDEIIMEKML
jgi:ribosomal protein S18 acetylase RimI-like enzyme